MCIFFCTEHAQQHVSIYFDSLFVCIATLKKSFQIGNKDHVSLLLMLLRHTYTNKSYTVFFYELSPLWTTLTQMLRGRQVFNTS